MSQQANNHSTIYKHLLELLANQHNPNAIEELLQVLLTEKEIHEVVNRLHIFALLQQGKPQRDISNEIGVGIATVTRGAKAFKQHNVDELIPNLADLTKS